MADGMPAAKGARLSAPRLARPAMVLPIRRDITFLPVRGSCHRPAVPPCNGLGTSPPRIGKSPCRGWRGFDWIRRPATGSLVWSVTPELPGRGLCPPVTSVWTDEDVSSGLMGRFVWTDGDFVPFCSFCRWALGPSLYSRIDGTFNGGPPADGERAGHPVRQSAAIRFLHGVGARGERIPARCRTAGASGPAA